MDCTGIPSLDLQLNMHQLVSQFPNGQRFKSPKKCWVNLQHHSRYPLVVQHSHGQSPCQKNVNLVTLNGPPRQTVKFPEGKHHVKHEFP